MTILFCHKMGVYYKNCRTKIIMTILFMTKICDDYKNYGLEINMSLELWPDFNIL